MPPILMVDSHTSYPNGRQPYLLAIGRSQIDNCYLMAYKRLVPGQATSGLCAFDELVKAHCLLT